MSSISGTETTLDIAPKPPTPLYPDVPWWAVLLTAFVFAIVGTLFGVYGMRGITGESVKGAISGSSVVVDTVSYIPHILLLFGVLADMFTLDGVWSIPSLIGVLSIFANYVFQYFWKGIEELTNTATKIVERGTGTGSADANPLATTTPSGGKRQKAGANLFENYKACSVQGFEYFSSQYAPQTLVVTATVFSYYCYDLVRNRGWINSLAAILAFVAAYIGEAAVIDFQNDAGCSPGFSSVASGLRALFEGLMFGGIGYGVVQTYAPTRLPSSTISPFPRKTVSDLSPGPDGKMYDKDGYPFVVLPNGQAVPDISDAKARAAFGQMANAAAGQVTSLASNCPGVAAGCPGTR